MKLAVYLVKRFMLVFFAALIFFALILELVDLLMNIWDYISNKTSPQEVGRVILLYLPKTISFSLPLSVLFASAYTLSDMYAKNELVIIFTSGISLFRFVLPLLVFSFFASFGLFYFEDLVVVPTYSRKVSLQNALTGYKPDVNNNNVIIQADNGKTVYSADFYDDQNKRISGFLVIQRNDAGSLLRIIKAQSASWYNDRWNMTSPLVYAPSGEDLTISGDVADVTLVEPPETFRRNVVSVEEINAAQARDYIGYLQRVGLPSVEARSLYYKKYAFPFVVFIVVFLSVGLSGKTQKNVLIISLVLCVCAAVLFYVSQMVTMLLAKFGVLSPFLGAWFPVILFIILSMALIRFART